MSGVRHTPGPWSVARGYCDELRIDYHNARGEA